MKRKEVFESLEKSYFFAQLAKKRAEYEKAHPEKKVISLGIGDAVLPLVPGLKKAFDKLSSKLITEEGFMGYGANEGLSELREKFATDHYQGQLSSEEIFISNGAKSQLAQLQSFFSQARSVGVLTPSYPVYVDGSLLQGIANIHYLPLTEENGFCYDLEKAPDIDILYLCQPNNPTGTVLTREQLSSWVDVCRQRGILLVVDTAYSAYIQSSHVCKSVYEIPGANEVAIEIGSFSKSLGFSGVRGGWIALPKTLTYEGGARIYDDWSRFHATTFNGAALFSQIGMLASFEENVKREAKAQAEYYMENAATLKRLFEELGFRTYGGLDAPYVWVSLGQMKSWDFFDVMLNEKQLVITPGAGFGLAGEHFARLSAFLTKDDLYEVEKRLLTHPIRFDSLIGATV